MDIFNHFQQLALSKDQEISLQKLEAFVNGQNQVFLLKGYAGSGKTTIIKGLVDYLDSLGKSFIVMAPTGRAAKVLRDKTGFGSTIHKGIYNFDKLESINETSEDEAEHSFHYYFPIKAADSNNKIIIVDESSMVSSKESKNELFTFGTNVLLNDLMTFASVQTTHNKIIFVGDPAQLPPFGDNHSWALDKSYFSKLKISCDETEMKQVLRQGDNLILKNAGKIRKAIGQEQQEGLKFDFDDKSFVKLAPIDIIDKFLEFFPKPEVGDGMVISYSNAQCYHYNSAIRQKLFDNQTNVTEGDILLINNNNYFTYGTELFNGDLAKVIAVNQDVITQSAPVWCIENGQKTRKTITLYFREITIRLPNYHDDIVCNIIDSHLHSIDRDLSFDEMRALYINFVMRFNEEQKIRKGQGLSAYKIGSEEFKKALKTDRYFNALRVKFGYAITCHKAQGGEWDKVFVDYTGRVSLNNEPLRWCYTATTRGINTIFAINPPHFGTFNKLKFSAIGNISSIPNDSLAFGDVPLSPFHSPLQHKCKSLKYWEIAEKLENTEYHIENVESFEYLERYAIRNEDITLKIEAYHKNSGHFIEKFSVLGNVNPILKTELEGIFNSQYDSTININYSPGLEFLAALYSRMQQACDSLSIKITNVVEGHYFINYYLVTDAVFAYIQFYYNDKGQLTTAMPKTFNCNHDTKLEALILNLLQYAN